MNRNTARWTGLLLAWPMMALAQQATPPAAEAIRIERAAPKAELAAPLPATPGFDLKHSAVQHLLRVNASAAGDDSSGKAAADQRADADGGQGLDARLGTIRFRAPRRLHHTDCDSFSCVAYDADDQPLYSFPRDQLSGRGSLGDGDALDAWLSCQDTNDLLTTFERFDHCGGLRFGPPPLRLRDAQISLPAIRL
jgi:hypothetical protein